MIAQIRTLVALFALFLLNAASSVQAADIADHPLIDSISNSTPTEIETAEAQTFNLITGIQSIGLQFDSVALVGRVTRIQYKNPNGRTPYSILKKYAKALKRADFEEIYRCTDQVCGPSYAGDRWTSFNGTIEIEKDGAYVVGRRSGDGGDAYVAVAVASQIHQITIIEADAAPIEQAQEPEAAIDMAPLSDALDQTGRVVVPGIAFENGAELKAGSQSGLAAIAQLLADRPNLKVWIVGHTDATGDAAVGLSLSSERAEMVKQALIAGHGIDPSRVEAFGVGPLAPSTSNATEAGRAANRRLEVVARP